MVYDIPGYGKYDIQNVVFDLNGTLAVDGEIGDTVAEKIKQLSGQFRVVIASSDIHNNLASLAESLGVEYHCLKAEEIASQKAELVRRLGAEHTIAVGNGTNDREMLKEAAIGITILGREGASVAAILNANLVAHSPEEGIDCILKPKRMVATLLF
jgi:P-type E1-E2 ATPase